MEAEFGYSQKQQAQRTPERRVSCEHFVVEDLLDFSNDDGVDVHDDNNNTNVPLLDDQSTTHNSANSNSSDDSTTGVTPVDSGNSAFSEGNNNDSIFAPVSDIGSQGFSDTQFSGELGVPYDDLAELEWLSNFVEESFSSEDLHKFNIISGMSSAMKSTRLDSESVGASETRYYQVEPQRPESVPSPMFNPEVPVPGKARSKRSRAAPCNWTSRLMVLSNGSPDPQQPMQHMPVPGSPVMKPGRKGPKKKTGLGSGSGSNSGLDVSNGEVRKCLHCATDKTPQWRTGPMGPKTLCNACGVRYKSGRLVPEYRPAASPTFMLTKHSNSHRKVMELRRQKELMKQQHHHQQQYHHQQLMLHHHNTPSSMMFDPSNSDDYLIHQHIGPDYRQLI